MRVMLLCEAEAGGGAMRSAYRLLMALRQHGHEAVMRARLPASADPVVLGPRGALGRAWMSMRRRVDALPLRAYPDREAVFFSPGWIPDRIAREVAWWRPDVVHVHWINNGFMGIAGLARIRAPQVWSLHDSWTFTGGCHYHTACERFTAACGACPALGSRAENDLSRRMMRRKLRAWSALTPQLIAPSRWMAERARRAPVTAAWPVSVIGNPLDGTVFRPGNARAARQRWHLPEAGPIILFAALHADDHNKGWDLLQPALRQVAQHRPDAVLATVGHPPSAGYGDLGMRVFPLGPVSDEAAMASIIQASDVVAVPSRSESFSYSVLEAQACGAVPVAFRVGGIPDLIETGMTGWLADPLDTAGFAAGLEWALDVAPARRAAMATGAAERCASDRIAEAHLAVYGRAIAGRGA